MDEDVHAGRYPVDEDVHAGRYPVTPDVRAGTPEDNGGIAERKADLFTGRIRRQ